MIILSYRYYCIVSQPLRLDGSVDKHPLSVATLDIQQQHSWFVFHQKVPSSYIPVATQVHYLVTILVVSITHSPNKVQYFTILLWKEKLVENLIQKNVK